MKIVFFSDVHGNQYAFARFLQEMQEHPADRVVFLGDIFGYYYGQRPILERLRRSGFVCLMGNHDKMYLDMLDGHRSAAELCQRYGSSYERNLTEIPAEDRAFLRGLPREWHTSCDGIEIAAFHASPADPLEGRIYPDTPIDDPLPYARYDYVILGHTHHKMVRKVGHTVVIDPGSLGQQRDGKGCSYLVLDTVARTYAFQIVEYDLDPLLREIEMWDPDKPFLSEVLTRKPRSP